jgi:hypothetical protein
MGARKDMMKLVKENDRPGPGAYMPDDTTSRKKEPNFGFGKDSRLKQAGKNPSPEPSRYRIKDDLMYKTTSSWGMGYGKKTDLSKTLADTPGPGSYEMRSTITDGRKYGIGNKMDMFRIDRDNSPGPGSYQSEVVNLKKQHRSFKWSKSTRFDIKNRNNSPGPGNYQPTSNFGGAKYGFGSFSRDKINKTDDVPGPGQYEQKGLLNNIKGYETSMVSKQNR